MEVEIEEEEVMFNEEHDKLVEEILEEDNISLPEVDQSWQPSRGLLFISRPRRGWLPSIYMRGGAPFEVMEEMEELHHHYKLH